MPHFGRLLYARPSCGARQFTTFTGTGGTLSHLPPAVRTGGLRTTVRPQPPVVRVDRLVPCPPFGTRRSFLVPGETPADQA